MIGKVITHYRIIEKIGEGGMGVVYKAEDTRLERTVALKFLPAELTCDEDAKLRFIREAQAAAALDHPHICTVYEIDEVENQTFIAMAYVAGMSLKDKIAEGPLQIDDALDIAVQVARGLQAAHEKGIVHRDIKPSNIMLTEKGQAKIMDFGLAKLEWGPDLTKTATLMGTVAYMSPEQARGEKVDHRTDIWSLGCVIYEIITGQRPFRSEHEQTAIYAILNEEPQPVSALRKDVPVELENVLHICFQKDPRKRYRNLNDLLNDLKSVDENFADFEIQSNTEAKSITPSVAVLPFVNMSADPENEYFSDGLAEELINALTKIKDLRVVARTSSFAFKGEKIDIREVGRRLNVKTVLEGSVRKAGNRLRITSQLIKVEDGYHLWSERYDRDLEDVFAIQDEITAKIVNHLKSALAVPSSTIKERHPSNLEAFEWYLKGRYSLNKFFIDEAISYYNQAIDMDPEYALAYAALAEAFVLLSTGFDILPSRDAMPKAREAAQKALQIDPTLSEAYVSLGLVATCYDWDRKAAGKYFREALEFNPNSAIAHQWIEFYLTFLEGKFDEAIASLEQAQELDPLNILIKIRLGYMFYYKRDFDRAIRHFQKIIDLEPDFPMAYHGLMDAYGQKGMLEEALAAGEHMLKLSGKMGEAVAHIGVLGFYYARTGHEDKARKFLSDLEERSKKGYVSSFWVGVIFLGLGDTDKAFEWFEKAFEERDGNLIYITIPPPFDSIRPDPRYKQLLKKMGLENLLEN